LSSSVKLESLDGLAFPYLILGSKQCEKNTDARFLSRELFHYLHTPPYLLKAPFNDVRGSYMLPPGRWVIHVHYAGIKILLHTLDQSWIYFTVFLYEHLGLGFCLQAIGGIVDLV